MLYIDFCRGPKGTWVGCVQYNNGRAFASGRILDILVSNMKARVYHIWGLSQSSVMLSSRQMDPGEFDQKHGIYMSPKFRGKFWNEAKQNTIKGEKMKGTIRKIVVDGILYKTITEAEKTLGIKDNTLGQALRNKQKMCLGHSIAYADELPQFQIMKKEETVQQKPKEEKKGTYTYEEKDGVLYVYERKLVAKYDIEKQ